MMYIVVIEAGLSDRGVDDAILLDDACRAQQRTADHAAQQLPALPLFLPGERRFPFCLRSAITGRRTRPERKYRVACMVKGPT